MSFIKGITGVGAAMLIGLSAQSAQAGYVVDLTEQGSNVVATGSGAIDLTGLAYASNAESMGSIVPGIGGIVTGASADPFALLDAYTGITGPLSFGPGDRTYASSGSGDVVAIDGYFNELVVPQGYVSDSPLSDTSTYLSQTFSSLGVTPGTYEWTWGSGAGQNFTLVIGTAVPEPSSWAMMLIGFAGLGFMGYRSAGLRRRTACNA